MRTLIDYGFDTADLISRGLRDKGRHDEAIELIKNYGMDADLIKELNEPEPGEKVNPNDDPKNYRMHYQWSN